MSVKHVKEYFNKISNDYLEMIEVLHELEDAVSQNIVSQEKLDETTKSVEKLKENYMRWSYMMYLLNQPNKKDKKKVYEKRMEKFLNNIPKKDRIENVLSENKEVIKNFRNKINNEIINN